MKTFIISVQISLFMISGICVAQDTIYMSDGEQLNSKVIEITPTEVKYKDFDNQDGPLYTIDKSTVYMIEYPGGKKDVFGAKVENQVMIEPAKIFSQADLDLKKMRKAVAATSVGAICIIAGVPTLGHGITSNSVAEMILGGALTAIGPVLVVTGSLRIAKLSKSQNKEVEDSALRIAPKLLDGFSYVGAVYKPEPAFGISLSINL